MKIYNTLTKRKDEFFPQTVGHVSMYVCGPTVYNLIHIGNARPMIVFDAFRRFLEYKGIEVNYVSNFTDVDDKIIKKALEEGVDASVISERYIEECKKDMEALNIKPATVHPKATQEIPEMLSMIDELVLRGYAYVAKDGTVYYRTRAFKEYGKLSHKNIDELQGGNRSLLVSGEDQKEDPLDFVLWKPKKDGEPYWDSLYCQGRPGWHIECSAMSKKYLGKTIDIHAGGEDLIFPHHENEIAQSEAANGVHFARYWMHNAFLNIDNKKMSKSAGNFFTVRDILRRYEPMVLRFFMLSAHYRSPLNFTEELMKSAKSSFDRIRTCVDKLNSAMKMSDGDKLARNEYKLIEDMKTYRMRFEEAMSDDNNTADAISVIFDLVKYINVNMIEITTKECFRQMKAELLLLCDILGLIVEKQEEVLDEDIEKMIEARQQARKDRDFAKADQIRDDLLKKGIILEDTREGVTWKRA